MKLSRILFRAARTSRDVDAVSTGNPRNVTGRVKNKLIGRALSRAGFWRWLWK